MKKVLLIAGFALCASFAFAQPARVNPLLEKTTLRQQAGAPVEQKARVDYKASIFAKDATAPFQTITFASTDAITFGKVLAADRIDDTTVAGSAHANTAAGSEWMYFANRAALSTLDTVDYGFFWRNDSVLAAYMGPEHGVTGDDGFVGIDAFDAATSPSDLAAIINSYVTLPQVTAPSGVVMVDLQFHQFAYRKRYQQFFIDYKTSPSSNIWWSFEVNSSVDYAPNDGIADTCAITLPTEAMSSTGRINLRFRYYSYNEHPERSSSDHGYGWLIDDVKFIQAEGARWAFGTPGYIDGFYGMIPEGFNLPIAFTISARNTGTVDLTNVQLVINHRYMEGSSWVDNTDWELTQDVIDLPAGTPRANKILNINERGFMATGDGFGSTAGFYQATPTRWDSIGFLNYMADPDSMDARWTRRGLPTDHRGKNQFIIKAVAQAGSETMTHVIDTITYTVTGLTGGTHNDSLIGLTVPGYRWGNDNGVIPSGSEFLYEMMSSGVYGWATEQSHRYNAGYTLDVRFNTPDVLPDTNWAFLGLEIIPATNLNAEDIEGVRIGLDAALWFQPSADRGFNLYNLNVENFFGTSITTVNANAAFRNGQGDNSYVLPGARYNAVNIVFPEQPPIYTNSSFLFGYENKGGLFSAARTRTAYNTSTDSVTSYSENPALADYSHQFSPSGMCWTGYMYDPIVQSALVGYYWDWYPLIRTIVGPKINFQKAAVNIICNEDENSEDPEPTSYFVYRGRVLCDTVDSVAKGITYKYEIYPGYEDEDNATARYSHSVITSLIIDGQEVDLSEEAIAANPLISREEYDVINTDHDGLNAQGDADPSEVVWPALLKRYMYTVYFEDVQGDHSIEAHTAYRELSINEVAPEVKLRLAPNPATSQVRLNIAGVNGKVNCNVIDMSGRVIYNADINAENEHIINLNGVPAGAYFVRITNDNFSKVEKLIVR